MINAVKIKRDFPIFKHQPDLIYLDSTATSLKPQSVIDKTVEYYSQYSANVFRGLYDISAKATTEYELTRQITAKFINARSSNEIVFTRSTTESINLLAFCLGKNINKGDEIVTTVMEHHSNFVPWQQLAQEVGADFKVIDIDNEGRLDLNIENPKSKIRNPKQAQSPNFKFHLNNVVTKKTKILALTYVSNVLGTINPIKEIIKAAKDINPQVIIVIDAAQAAPHLPIDVQNLGADFLVFSSHKMLGPTGVGVLWGKLPLLNSLMPYNFGGEMIEEVFIKKTTFRSAPHRFEAGTPNIAGVIAFKDAIKYLTNLGMENVRRHELSLGRYALARLNDEFENEIRILGPITPEDRQAVTTFTFNNIHSHDLADMLNSYNICVRAGHHCAMPLHNRLKVTSTSRASFYIYNDEDDVEKLIEGLKKVTKLFA